MKSINVYLQICCLFVLKLHENVLTLSNVWQENKYTQSKNYFLQNITQNNYTNDQNEPSDQKRNERLVEVEDQLPENQYTPETLDFIQDYIENV